MFSRVGWGLGGSENVPFHILVSLPSLLLLLGSHLGLGRNKREPMRAHECSVCFMHPFSIFGSTLVGHVLIRVLGDTQK